MTSGIKGIVKPKPCTMCGMWHERKSKYCSLECGSNARNLKKGTCVKYCFCRWCGIVFKPRLNLYRTYCSRECGFKGVGFDRRKEPAIREKKQVVCRTCGCEFRTANATKRRCDSCIKHHRFTPLISYIAKIQTCVDCEAQFEVKSAGRYRLCGECAYRSHRRSKSDSKRRRRASKKHAVVKHETVNAYDIYERDGWKCQICGCKVRRSINKQHNMAPSLDHIIPLSRGGKHVASNVQLAHRICNSRKSDAVNGNQLRLFG